MWEQMDGFLPKGNALHRFFRGAFVVEFPTEYMGQDGPYTLHRLFGTAIQPPETVLLPLL